MIDFERAVIKSFKKHFSYATVKGCLFHFSQSLFKNLTKNHLKDKYINDEVFRLWFKKVFCLALLPLDEVEIQFEKLLFEMEDKLSLDESIGQNGKNFAQYVLSTYFETNVPK